MNVNCDVILHKASKCNISNSNQEKITVKIFLTFHINEEFLINETLKLKFRKEKKPINYC